MAGKRKRKRRKKGVRYERRNLGILVGVLALAALVFTGVNLILSNAVKKHDDGTILAGIYIGSTDVSGMNAEEAKKAIEAALVQYGEEKISFHLETGDTVEAALKELELSAKDADTAIESALSYGKKGTPVQAYKIIRASENGELKHRIPLKLQVSKKRTDAVLKERSKELLSLPVNASVTQQDGQVTVIEEQKGETPDTDAAVKSLNRYLNDEWNQKGGTLEVAVKKSDPEITAEDLKDVTDLLGTHTTFYGADGSGRSQNVETGAKHINGVFLQPGDEVSANALMEPYTYENGYTEAASYESNKVVNTMGGGICQVSTTLYNALLYAELEIVERYPHSMLVGYAEPSKDAAIAEDLLDLVFKNNLEAPVYIEAVLSDGNITFNVYGKETRSPGRTLEFISESTESTETQGKRFVETDNPIGYLEKQSDAQPEITAQLWKVVYQDGTEVSRDIINYSSYVAAPETYGVGTVSDNPEYTKKMSDAILTQDEAAIMKAIEEIQQVKQQ